MAQRTKIAKKMYGTIFYKKWASRWITISGKTQTLRDWIKDSGLKSSTVRQRFYVLGWDIEKALGEEVRHRSS